MSRKGKTPIVLPKGVEVTVKENMAVVKGPKGTLSSPLMDGFALEISEGQVLVVPEASKKDEGNFLGLTRAVVENMVVGTSAGYEKRLVMIGTGYRAQVKGKDIDLQVGNSHPTLVPIPEGINVQVEKNTLIIINGVDKQLVGQFASDVRSKKPPEPYQGKGIRYENEQVRRKAGKSGK